jgi:DNA (cytosine-5)-methyltransferase 1
MGQKRRGLFVPLFLKTSGSFQKRNIVPAIEIQNDQHATASKMKPPSHTYTLIDLFSGAGGFTLGFKEAGFKPVLAVEKEADFAKTYKENFGAHVIAEDIAAIIEGDGIKKEADVVIGGPPCQGFSNLTGNRASDPRRAMWQFFMDFVEQSACKVFVIENVPNLLSSPEGEAIIARARLLKFEVSDESFGVLDASKFGVPQRRRRAFIIGSKLGPVALPTPVALEVSVKAAFTKGLYPGDVAIPLKPTLSMLSKQPAQGPDLHIARNPTKLSLERYSHIPEGGNRFDLPPGISPPCWIRKKNGGTDLFGRLQWRFPAKCTIRCEFYKPEKGRYLHPKEDRPITHWEAARLQTFPDSFKWHGSKIRIAIQIGNAVPPILARAIADQVKNHLDSHLMKSA